MYYMFRINPPEDDCEYTKRDFLCKNEDLFEPGGIAIFTIRAKMSIQKKWSTRIDWDAHLDVNIVKETGILV